MRLPKLSERYVIFVSMPWSEIGGSYEIVLFCDLSRDVRFFLFDWLVLAFLVVLAEKEIWLLRKLSSSRVLLFRWQLNSLIPRADYRDCFSLW
jgi:hypothetical protein